MVGTLVENIQRLFCGCHRLCNITFVVEDLHKFFTPLWLIVYNKNAAIHWLLLSLLSSVGVGRSPFLPYRIYLLLIRLKENPSKTIFLSLARLLSKNKKCIYDLYHKNT